MKRFIYLLGLVSATSTLYAGDGITRPTPEEVKQDEVETISEINTESNKGRINIYTGITSGSSKIDMSFLHVGVEGDHFGVLFALGMTSETVDNYRAIEEPGFSWHYKTGKKVYDDNPVGIDLTYKFDVGLVIGGGVVIANRYDLYYSAVSNTYWYGNGERDIIPDGMIGYRYTFGDNFNLSVDYSTARGLGGSAGWRF